MSRASPDDQLKFLLNCVKHSNNGKIDFVEVAKECGIVSKGAAAKRYERLMKANGIHPNGGPSEKPPTHTASRERSKASIAKAAAAKRRKIEMTNTQMKVDEEDDGLKMEPKIEPTDIQRIMPGPITSNEPQVSQTDTPTPPTILPLPFPPPPPPSPMPGYVLCASSSSFMPSRESIPDDHYIFEDFCTPELFMPRTYEEQPRMELILPIPPQPQEVTMRDLSIDEKQTAIGNGTGPLDSILILD